MEGLFDIELNLPVLDYGLVDYMRSKMARESKIAKVMRPKRSKTGLGAKLRSRKIFDERFAGLIAIEVKAAFEKAFKHVNNGLEFGQEISATDFAMPFSRLVGEIMSSETVFEGQKTGLAQEKCPRVIRRYSRALSTHPIVLEHFSVTQEKTYRSRCTYVIRFKNGLKGKEHITKWGMQKWLEDLKASRKHKMAAKKAQEQKKAEQAKIGLQSVSRNNYGDIQGSGAGRAFADRFMAQNEKASVSPFQSAIDQLIGMSQEGSRATPHACTPMCDAGAFDYQKISYGNLIGGSGPQCFAQENQPPLSYLENQVHAKGSRLRSLLKSFHFVSDFISRARTKFLLRTKHWRECIQEEFESYYSKFIRTFTKGSNAPSWKVEKRPSYWDTSSSNKSSTTEDPQLPSGSIGKEEWDTELSWNPEAMNSGREKPLSKVEGETTQSVVPETVAPLKAEAIRDHLKPRFSEEGEGKGPIAVFGNVSFEAKILNYEEEKPFVWKPQEDEKELQRKEEAKKKKEAADKAAKDWLDNLLKKPQILPST